MTLIEYTTIYLAVGAPFGVQFFLRRRDEKSFFTLVIKSLGAVLFWFVFAARFIRERWLDSQNLRFTGNSDAASASEIELASQKLQNCFELLSVNNILSFFEFREVLERYIGLTLAARNQASVEIVYEHELAVFRVAGRTKSDLQLAGQILHRKNAQRLQNHQLTARRDFLQTSFLLIENSAAVNGELAAREMYQKEAEKLCRLLDDSTALISLRETSESANAPQSVNIKSGSHHENDLWTALQPAITIKRMSAAASKQTIPMSSHD